MRERERERERERKCERVCDYDGRALLTLRRRSCTRSLVCVGIPPVMDVVEREAGRVGGAVTTPISSGTT